MRLNIWRALLSASEQEILDGMDFYPGAYGLCKLFGRMFNQSTSTVAGIYAALSPMNTWDTNVANIYDLLKYKEKAKVNTSNVNKEKALRLLQVDNPESVLRGRKVIAFYRAINGDQKEIPIDRHLINLALGVFPDKNVQSRLASNQDLYSRIESVYRDLGEREGIGNRLASIAWFVQRRILRSGQLPIPVAGPICCGKLMYSFGRVPRRFYCSICHRLKGIKTPKPKADFSELIYDVPISKEDLFLHRERPCINLRNNHSFANKSRWQYLARFVVMYRTGEILRSDEHVHHINGKKLDCATDNLEVLMRDSHGRLHGRYQSLYMLRDKLGRFVDSSVPSFDAQYEEGVPF
jgi:hypothetical protein